MHYYECRIDVFYWNLNAAKPDSKHFQRKVECERMAWRALEYQKGNVDRHLSVCWILKEIQYFEGVSYVIFTFGWWCLVVLVG